MQLHKTRDVKVYLDVILAIGDATLPGALSQYNTTPFVLIKTFFGMIQNIFVGDIQNARIAYPQAQIRVIKPSKWLPGYFLGFNHADEMIQIGFEEAKNVLSKSPWH